LAAQWLSKPLTDGCDWCCCDAMKSGCEVLSCDSGRCIERAVERMAPMLRNGAIAAYPTETFYGLAVAADQIDAVERLAQLKQRSGRQPFPLIAASRAVVDAWCEIDAQLEPLLEALWPGPITVAARPKRSLHAALLAADETVGIRVSSLKGARLLAEASGGVITATSANLAGAPPAMRAEEIDAELLQSVDVLLDAGATPGGFPSTVVAVRDGRVQVLRDGAIARSRLAELLGYPPQ